MMMLTGLTSLLRACCDNIYNLISDILVKVKFYRLLDHSERVIKKAYRLCRPMNRFKFIALKYASVIIIKDTTRKRCNNSSQRT